MLVSMYMHVCKYMYIYLYTYIVDSFFDFHLRSCSTLRMGQQHLSRQASTVDLTAKEKESDIDTEPLGVFELGVFGDLEVVN